MGFSVITPKRPFYLFTEEPAVRLAFLRAFACVPAIPTRPSKENKSANESQVTIEAAPSQMQTKTKLPSCSEVYASLARQHQLDKKREELRRLLIASEKRKVRIVPQRRSHESGATEENLRRNRRSHARISSMGVAEPIREAAVAAEEEDDDDDEHQQGGDKAGRRCLDELPDSENLLAETADTVAEYRRHLATKRVQQLRPQETGFEYDW